MPNSCSVPIAQGPGSSAALLLSCRSCNATNASDSLNLLPGRAALAAGAPSQLQSSLVRH